MGTKWKSSDEGIEDDRLEILVKDVMNWTKIK